MLQQADNLLGDFRLDEIGLQPLGSLPVKDQVGTAAKAHDRGATTLLSTPVSEDGKASSGWFPSTGSPSPRERIPR